MDVQTWTDPRAAWAAAAEAIDADPVRTNILATNLARCIAGAPSPGARWFVARDGAGRVAGLAMWTPPHRPHLSSDDPEVGAALAEVLAAGPEEVTGVNGMRGGVAGFVRRWRELRGGTVEVDRRDVLYDLPGPVRLRRDVPGAARSAVAEDRDLLDAWARAFIVDIGEQPRPDATAESMLAAGELRLWEVDGAPVAMAYANPPAGGFARIGWVYTPDAERGRGYAGAVTGDVSARAQAAGHACMLHADRDNPGSKAAYRRLGYRLVGQAEHLRLLP